MEQFSVDAVELLRDPQLLAVEVDGVPGEAEDFTTAEAEDQHEHEGGVERFVYGPKVFKERPGMLIAATPKSVVRGEACSRRPARTTGSRSSVHESSCHHALVVMRKGTTKSAPRQIQMFSSAGLIREVFRMTGPEMAGTAPARSVSARRFVSA
ncbi:hypothetical protein ACIBQ6_16195 [Nonomuraea sp. NPDC049655]|uniref:hypothetical protein n=1 Tax=Nonomuraea sp. NPDC049655 TaxID=3364355 RepID=UPI00379E5D10